MPLALVRSSVADNSTGRVDDTLGGSGRRWRRPSSFSVDSCAGSVRAYRNTISFLRPAPLVTFRPPLPSVFTDQMSYRSYSKTALSPSTHPATPYGCG